MLHKNLLLTAINSGHIRRREFLKSITAAGLMTTCGVSSSFTAEQDGGIHKEGKKMGKKLERMGQEVLEQHECNRKAESAGKVRFLLTWYRSFCNIPTTRVYRIYSESCWILVNAIGDVFGG